MRTRKELEKALAEKYNLFNGNFNFENREDIQVEILLDIRDILLEIKKEIIKGNDLASAIQGIGDIKN